MIAKNDTGYRPSDIDATAAEEIPSVLLCAGLLHDLGNPPFGHFGEAVIGDWFKQNLPAMQYKGEPLTYWLTGQMRNDLENFEGNAQALRILLKANHPSEINLSFAIISTLVKYPTNSSSFNKNDPDVKKHKPGYFLAEEEALCKVSDAVGTTVGSEIKRHPLTFLLEASDDIAYATADLEDAFQKGLFRLDEFIQYFETSIKKSDAEEKAKHYSTLLIGNLRDRRQSECDDAAFSAWLTYTRRWLMYVAAYRFSRKYDEIMRGTYGGDLFEETFHSLTIKILKNAMGKFAFNTSGILKLELSAQTILSFLLDHFVHAVLYYGYPDPEKGWVPSKADKKYWTLLPDHYKQDYENTKTGDEAYDLYLRLLMVTDYISGMTDSYARTLYRELSGIE